ncbi:hypothetical protein EMCRGX_G012721 [Ephydatia muelleri]
MECQVQRYCRVCGHRLLKKTSRGNLETTYNCAGFSVELKTCFQIDTSNDTADYPANFCKSCRLAMSKAKEAAEKKIPYKCMVKPYDWSLHCASTCKEPIHSWIQLKDIHKQKPGRQPGITPNALLHHVNTIAPPKVVCHRKEPQLASTQVLSVMDLLTCPICKGMLSQPLKLHCNAVLCAKCIADSIATSASTQCPCCEGAVNLVPGSVQPAPDLTQRLLCDVMVSCDTCNRDVRAGDYDSHECHRLGVIEEQCTSKVIRRILSENTKDNIIQIKTGGTPLTLVRVTKAHSSKSEEVCRKTLKRRVCEVQGVRSLLSPERPEKILEEEIRALGSEEKKMILTEAGLTLDIEATTGLAMKAAIGMPWNQLRTLRRWLAHSGVQLASEKKLRLIAKEMIGENLEAEIAPFCFSRTSCEDEIRAAAYAYTPSLIQKVTNLIDENESTCVFACFEAQDTIANLHIALDRFKEEVVTLAVSQWKGYNIRVFLSGDYEFLSAMYGTSGASGKQPCLWCLVTIDDLERNCSLRGPFPVRTVESMCNDYKRFIASGGNIKKVKYFNNCKGEPLFPIPLNQVCLPALHISMGIFFKLYSLLEEECHMLDLKLALQLSTDAELTTASYEEYATAVRELTAYKEQLEVLQQEHCSLKDLFNYSAIIVGESSPLLSSLIEEDEKYSSKIAKLEQTISDVHKKLNKGFAVSEGPFVKGVETALQSLNVQRQQYHGGAFVGNHVNKMLQCHKLYNKNCVTEEEKTTLAASVKEFFGYLDTTFPGIKRTVKMHILEMHVNEWMEAYNAGFALMGEQGTEAIHAHFNKLYRTYGCMANKVERLKCIMKEHYLSVCPNLNALRPEVRARKRKQKD